MNREKKTLLNIQLFLQYYKNDNILDRYHRIIESGIIFDNEILNEMQPNIYVVKYNKYIKLEKEIDRLNNIIKELSKDVDMWNKKYNEQFNIINKLEEYCWELKAMGCREGALDMLDKIEELKNGDNNG